MPVILIDASFTSFSHGSELLSGEISLKSSGQFYLYSAQCFICISTEDFWSNDLLPSDGYTSLHVLADFCN